MPCLRRAAVLDFGDDRIGVDLMGEVVTLGGLPLAEPSRAAALVETLREIGVTRVFLRNLGGDEQLLSGDS